MLCEYLQAVWCDHSTSHGSPAALDDIGWLGVSNRICKQFAAAFGIVSFQ
jgi:hypothetical protein